MFGVAMQMIRGRGWLPRISDTEREALEAGTVWVESEVFSGDPDYERILAEPYGRLNEDEQAFLDGPTETLCRMVDPQEVGRNRCLSDDALAFLKSQGFMGLLIPRAYGGLEFSTLAISSIIGKVNAHSSTLGAHVIIPNSLGAAQLIKHYGTEDQKARYLPQLACGHYVPCFALTEPGTGSDAAAMNAEGVVFMDSDGEPRIRLGFRKRYVTLAPVANLVSVPFRLRDPEDLLGRGIEPGITVALVHAGTPGLDIGRHHEVIGEGFPNGPVVGTDVIVAPEAIIGGVRGAGDGWRMLMEQLAGGRGISLPGGAVGAMKRVASATGAYSMIRHQFGMPIGLMEGVRERVARIAAFAYLFEAARVFTCTAIDQGEQPPVLSALLKVSTTEHGRQVIIDGMDVFAGAGVMQGRNNVLGSMYAGTPVAVTVEGANIMTRALIIFGQGAIRCHPHALPLIRAAEAQSVPAFRRALIGWLAHTARNLVRAHLRGLTRGYSVRAPVRGPTGTYYRRLSWAAARFSLLTDCALLFLGNRLKARGTLSGHFADAMTWQILAIATLRRFEAEGRRSEDLPLVAYACEYALQRVQAAFEAIHVEFHNAPAVGWWLRGPAALALRINPLSSGPRGRLDARAAATLQDLTEQYDRLTAGVHHAAEDTAGSGRLRRAFRLRHEAATAIDKVTRAQRQRTLRRGAAHDLVDEALEQGIVTEAEADLLCRAKEAAHLAVEVDEFTPAEYYGRQSGSE